MTEIQNKKIESPFVFRSGMIIQCDNPDNNISISSYLKMAYKGIIGHVQLHILDILYEYGYVTRHTLSIITCDETPDDCKSAVRKLCRYGLLRKYHIEYQNSNGFVIKTVDYYGLSSTGIQICKIKGKSGRVSATKALSSFFCHSIDENTPPQEILKILAVNNLIAVFSRQYRDIIRKNYGNVFFKKNNYVYNQRGMCLLKSQESDSEILLIPVPARRNTGWQRELLDILKLIRSQLQTFTKEPVTALFLILVEDNIMACEANKSIRSCPELVEVPVLYASDWAANNDYLLDNLLTVRKNADYDIVRLAL